LLNTTIDRILITIPKITKEAVIGPFISWCINGASLSWKQSLYSKKVPLVMIKIFLLRRYSFLKYLLYRIKLMNKPARKCIIQTSFCFYSFGSYFDLHLKKSRNIARVLYIPVFL